MTTRHAEHAVKVQSCGTTCHADVRHRPRAAPQPDREVVLTLSQRSAWARGLDEQTVRNEQSFETLDAVISESLLSRSWPARRVFPETLYSASQFWAIGLGGNRKGRFFEHTTCKSRHKRCIACGVELAHVQDKTVDWHLRKVRLAACEGPELWHNASCQWEAQPMKDVKRIPPDTAIHGQNGYVKVCFTTSTPSTSR